MSELREGNDNDEENKKNEWLGSFRNPIVILATLILMSIIALIGASVLGIDRGVLTGMARADFARGLITYLFAVVTIGIAVALVLSALTGPEPTDANNSRFQRGKEILSLLLGVFGTIVGFYFAAETTKNKEEVTFQLSTLDLSPQPVGPTGLVTIRAIVRGGAPPYRFGAAQGSDTVEIKDIAFEGGWIVKQLQLKAPQQGELQTVHLIAEDSSGKRTETAAPVRRSAQD